MSDGKYIKIAFEDIQKQILLIEKSIEELEFLSFMHSNNQLQKLKNKHSLLLEKEDEYLKKYPDIIF